jgi:hypothetical protein
MKDEEKGAARTAGAMMAGAAILSVVAMAHHPTGKHGLGGLAQLVHGTMIAVLLVMLAGFARFAACRGLDRTLPLVGLVAYAASAVAHLIAATINGFAVPALAARGVPHDFFALSWELNQAFAGLGVYLTSAAFLAWSLDLVIRGPGATRALSVVGLAAAIGPAALFAAGAIEMNVAGASIVYAAHAAFALFVSVQMMRGKI